MYQLKVNSVINHPINLVINGAIATGFGVYYYDGWDAVTYSLAMFAMMQMFDALWVYIKAKWCNKE